MNKSIRKVAVALMVLLVALFVNLNYVQVVKGNEYRDDPNNRRVLLNEYASPRGPIVVDGSDIAKSVETKDELKYLRVYPDGKLYSPVTGYYSFLYGTSGIEEAEDSVLSGNDNRLFGTRLADILTGRNPRGGSVDLTINKAAQQAAYSAMTDSNGQLRRGAVVAIDPKTGAILAAVSTPSFDPNALSSHNSTAMAHAYACYSDIAYPVQGLAESSAVYRTRTERSIAVQLALREGGTDLLATKHQQDPNAYPLDGWVYSSDADGNSFRSKQSYAQQQFPSFGKTGCGDVPDDPTQMFVKDPTVAGPLHNRAFSERYAPGSTFKLVVAAAALKDGISPDGERLLSPNAYFPDTGTTAKSCPTTGGADCLENFQGEQCDNGTDATLAFALAKSCNTTFAYLAVERLGGNAIANEAKLFGFDADHAAHHAAAGRAVDGRFAAGPHRERLPRTHRVRPAGRRDDAAAGRDAVGRSGEQRAADEAATWSTRKSRPTSRRSTRPRRSSSRRCSTRLRTCSCRR